ncbi:MULTISPECIES: hypothetical protein [unclassified Rhodococcus (in: high G+C Gram-positive bacteria)]|uniref:DUF6197 family protein n=1 Tax=unclassified Rhodococcus (in: high G+C Gram-positive bacteria) TaxID=192944 RepID=UPI000B9AA8AF|nr:MULTISPECIES: hypothetical protein [unclassified Rhodococcus (in: high G+C Gram-positive bacteria)]OZE35651.1 hypothetical protein CH259_16640 [Rhodococcus sp. 05-2254-4]OZE48080.1 hypothetical protein CH261_09235 [Rhodococcus sp. 05-2254-3]OZE49291.1 hypothetical protein CH283_17020 [Rhodococcus sp. 05-2254-2]
MNAQEVLTKAADLIEVKGWTRGQFQDEAGCLCTVGAIILAGGGSFKYDEDGRPDDYEDPADTGFGITDAFKALEELVGQELVTWNDGLDRDKSDVVNAMRAAAKRVAA